MIRSLLVPLDGSPFAEQALPLAVALARKAGATVHLACVHVPVDLALPEGVILPDADPAVRAGEQEYLDGVARRLAGETGLTVNTALLDGRVADSLGEKAEAAGADMVVLTTHGRGPFGRFWLGSVADTLVRHLSVPTLLVRPREGENPPADPMPRRILVPLDGSLRAEQILGSVEELARLTGAAVTLLRVVAPVPPTGALGLPNGPVEEAARRLLERTAAVQEQVVSAVRQDLELVAERLRQRGQTVQTRVAVADSPAPTILAEAQTCGADLIALATHARRGVKRLLLGSVADKVVRGGTLPVLLLRPRPH